MTPKVTTRDDLKRQCLAALDAAAIEHPAGHQGKLAARYILRTQAGEGIEMMFEKGPARPANLWMNEKYAERLCDGSVPFRRSPAVGLYAASDSDSPVRYGRHSALKPMRDLANADLVCFTIEREGQLEALLRALGEA